MALFIYKVVRSIYTGRRKIFTEQKIITKENIVQVLNDSLLIHNQNATEIEYLFNYFKGDQPILSREKEIRPEINNKIVENHAQEIVSFKTGYVFGSPIQFVRHGESEDDNSMAILNDMFSEECKASKDKTLGESLAICGIAHRIVLPKKLQDGLSPFDLLPLDSTSTFIVRTNDIYKKPILGVTYSTDNYGLRTIGAYTDKEYFEVKNNQITSQKSHVLGMIPIIEYRNNDSMLGSFEIVLPILDALNIGTSDRLNDISQFVQSLIWLNNCDIDDESFNSLRQSGGIKTKSAGGMQATVQILTSALNQAETQTFIDSLYQTMLQIAGVPDRHSSTGGNTGQAIMLASGWQTAETHAKAMELTFEQSERQLLKLVLRILKDSSEIDLSVSDIDIKFSRNKTDNLLVKTQGLLNELQAGVHPKIAITNSGLYNDPEQVWIDSREYMQKWITADATSDNKAK